MNRSEDNNIGQNIGKNMATSKSKVAVCLVVLGIAWLGYYIATSNQALPSNSPSALTDDELVKILPSMRMVSTSGQAPDPRGWSPNEKKLIQLGRRFFFDTNFSKNGKIACATCHNPERSFTDGKKTAGGLETTSFNTPTLINADHLHWFFWNGRADSLEAQVIGPVENPKEHGFSRTKVAARVVGAYRLEYESLFGSIPIDLPKHSDIPPPMVFTPKVSDEVAAYALATLGDSNFLSKILKLAQHSSKQPIAIIQDLSAGPTYTLSSFDRLSETQRGEVNLLFVNFARAIAAFERTIVSTEAPFDQFVDRVVSQPADKKNLELALSSSFDALALNGLRIFTGRGHCSRCHQGPEFTDQQFHNIGLAAADSESIDLGRAQGMLIVKASPFNCLGRYFHHINTPESCRELEFLETQSSESVGAFKTPTLRNLRDTAPYGHDGRFAHIRDILNHYNSLGVKPAVGHTEDSLVPLAFSESELADLEAFLLSLSGSVEYFKGD